METEEKVEDMEVVEKPVEEEKEEEEKPVEEEMPEEQTPEEDVRQTLEEEKAEEEKPVEEKPEEEIVEVAEKPAESEEKEEHTTEEKPVEEQTVEEKPEEEENLMIDDVMTAMEVEDESSCDDLMIDDLMMETDTESDDDMEVEDNATNDEKPEAMKPEEEEKSVESEEEVVEDAKALEEKPEMKSTIVDDIDDEDENEQAPAPVETAPLPPASEEKPDEIKPAESKPVETKPEEKTVEINPTPAEPRAAATHTPLHTRLSQDAEAIYDDENLIEEGSDDDLHSLAIYVGSVSTTPEDSEVESENDSGDASSIEEMRIISGIMGSAPRGNERGRRDSVSREFHLRLPHDSRNHIPQGDAQDDDEDSAGKRTMKWNEPPSKRELVRPSITQGGAHAQHLNISSEHNTWCPWHANNDESVRRLIGVRKTADGYV